jgi:hypothetical protein
MARDFALFSPTPQTGIAGRGREVAQPLDRVIPIARKLLTLRDEEGHDDLWLWEHSERVMRLAQTIARLPEVSSGEPNELAVAVAGLFHDAGWAVQAKQKRSLARQILSRPTNDIQRELGAALLQDEAAQMLPVDAAHRAVEAVRECNNRYSTLIEAQILAEAENLDDVGVMNMLRQFRQYQAEGRPLTQLCDGWKRQQEYSYWEARVNDCFRFEMTRSLARERLKAVEHFILALGREQSVSDLEQVLREAGVEAAAASEGTERGG